MALGYFFLVGGLPAYIFDKLRERQERHRPIPEAPRFSIGSSSRPVKSRIIHVSIEEEYAP